MSDQKRLTLEEQYRATVAKHKPEMDEQVKIAQNAIKKLVKLSEKHGIPFDEMFGEAHGVYTPASMPPITDDDEPGSLTYDIVAEITGCYPSEEGWNYSSMSC